MLMMLEIILRYVDIMIFNKWTRNKVESFEVWAS